jgi:hypothetical protein
VNTKVGFTPNTTDEYALSYTRQEGAKNAPLHVTDPEGSQRNWSWPYWNIETIYFLSTTALGDRATLKTRLYRNSFDNRLQSFDDASQTTQTKGRAFNSYYADKAYGGSAQFDVALTEADAISLAFHYRRDKHVEWQQGFPTGFTEPKQTNLEDIRSASRPKTGWRCHPRSHGRWARATTGATSRRPRNMARRRAKSRRASLATRSAIPARSMPRAGSSGRRTPTAACI